MKFKVTLALILSCLGLVLFAVDKPLSPKATENTAPKSISAKPVLSPIGISVGLGVDGVSWTNIEKYSGGQIETNNFRVNPYAYFDFIYGTLSIGYETVAGELHQKTSSGNAVYYSLMGNEHMGFLSAKLVLKLPLELDKRFVLFPMVGVQFDWFIYSDYWASYNDSAKADMSDLYLVLGLGGDMFATDEFYIRLSFSVDINLTATPASPIYNESYSGYKIKGGLGFGIRL